MREVKAGTVWFNDPLTDNDAGPFGGFKQSGLGRELGREGLEAFQETKHVHIESEVAPKEWWYPYSQLHRRRAAARGLEVAMADQTEAPYLDAVVSYVARNPGRFHIPGHKGTGADPGLIEALGRGGDPPRRPAEHRGDRRRARADAVPARTATRGRCLGGASAAGSWSTERPAETTRSA